MPVLVDHDSSNKEPGYDLLEDLRGISRLYDDERYSRLGDVKGALAIAAAGFVSTVLIIVPDSKIDTWSSALRMEGGKEPARHTYIKDKGFGLEMTKLDHTGNFYRVDPFSNPSEKSSKTKIVLTSFSMLVKEYLHVWKHAGHNKKASKFFKMHWGVVLLQNREQLPGTPYAAKAAGQIQTRTGGRRYVIWDDAKWNDRMDEIINATKARDAGQQKRKRETKIENGIISKKKKKSEQKATTGKESSDDDGSNDEDHYLNGDEEIASPKQEASSVVVVSTQALSSLDDSLLNSPYNEVTRGQQATGEANVLESAEASASSDDVLHDVSNEMTSHEFDNAFDTAGLGDDTAST